MFSLFLLCVYHDGYLDANFQNFDEAFFFGYHERIGRGYMSTFLTTVTEFLKPNFFRGDPTWYLQK